MPAGGSLEDSSGLDGALQPSADATASVPLTCAPTLAAGLFHTCGIRRDCTVECWGIGKPSDPPPNTTYLPNVNQSSPPPGQFVLIAASAMRTCGARPGGGVECWPSSSGEPKPPAGVRLHALAVGPAHVCGIDGAQNLVCWGGNGSGPANPPSGAFVDVSAGYGYSCGVATDGHAHCWGVGTTATMCDTVVRECGQAMPTAGTFTMVAASNGATYGLRTDGEIAGWGSGIPAALPHGPFVALGDGQPGCAIRTDGTVACFLSIPSPEGNFTHVAVGGAHACGIHSDGSVTCWGQNNYGDAIVPPDFP